MKYEWDEEKNRINIKKHGISLETALAVFDDVYLYEWYDEKHSGYNVFGEWEDRYTALGFVDNVLFVVYTISEDYENTIRMISARKANKNEIKMYEEWCKKFI